MFGNLVSQTRGAENHWYHYDSQGSTRALTDGMEVITDTYTYRAFGHRQAEDGTSENMFQWIGEKGYAVNQDTGRYRLRRRDYSAGTGRFLGQDPLGFQAGDSNLYRNVKNNTTNDIDPSGLELYVTYEQLDWLVSYLRFKNIAISVGQAESAKFIDPVTNTENGNKFIYKVSAIPADPNNDSLPADVRNSCHASLAHLVTRQPVQLMESRLQKTQFETSVEFELALYRSLLSKSKYAIVQLKGANVISASQICDQDAESSKKIQRSAGEPS